MNDTQRQETPGEEQPAADAAMPTLEEALQQIAALDQQLKDANDKMLRALAEVENIRRRSDKERQDTAKFSVGNFARDMLSVADNLRRAVQAVPAGANEQLKNFLTGVEATERELLRIFENNGIKKVDPTGQRFDPNVHEVMFEIEDATKAPGTVVQVIDPGYMIHERLLRPARVGIAKGGSEPERVDQQA